MAGEKRGGLISVALANPRVTNSIIAIAGAVLLLIYAFIESIHAPFTVVGITFSEQAQEVIGVLIKELGFAAMIAVLINFSIEAFNRKRHDEEKEDLISTINHAHEGQRDAQIKAINRHIFQTVYERRIPSKMFREVEEQLLQSNFMRLDSIFHIVIEPHSEGQVCLSMSHRFKIMNLSSAPSIYPLTLGFDVINSLQEFYAVSEVRIGGTHLIDEAIPVKKSKKSDIHDWWDVVIEHPLAPDEVVECVVDYKRLSPKVGKEAICSRLPTERMSVRVTDMQRAFSVRAMSLHPRPEINRSSSLNDGCYEWELDGALFPGQGFLIDWVPKGA